MQREETLAGVIHPEWLTPADGVSRRRLDHRVTFPLEYGAPDLGWEGDNRLCLYANPKENTWELWRFEHDGQYRHTGLHSPPGVESISADQINKLIRRLIEIDTHRGFDPHKHTIEVAERIDEAHRKEHHDRLYGEIAPKLRHAFGRSYMPGIDILPRQAPAKR